ncbi:mitochondrial protein [Scheffersomyces amazonensis]|uniref:mitochondrial protein n=1 Tax=Scheffersomyces amazonensis TaxID=1078765 RepID=UPI00315CF03D
MAIMMLGIRSSSIRTMPSIRINSSTISKRISRTIKTSTMDWKPIKTGKGNLAILEQQAKSPILRRTLLGLMIAMPVISFALGCWQVKRLQWKTELITKGENALAQPAIEELPPNIDPSIIEEFQYRRFKCKGHFDYSQEIFLGPRIKNGEMGYFVITPFIRSSGGKPILVERGWIHKDKVVPESRKKGYLSHLAFPQGEIEIEALFRVMPEKSYLQFDHKKGERLFHVYDVPEMAEQTGCLPIYCQMIHDLSDHPEWRHNAEEAKKSSNNITSLFGLISPTTPKGGEIEDEGLGEYSDDVTMQYQEFEFIKQGVPIAPTPKIKYSNNHLQYLVTWFGLSLCSTICLIYAFMKKGNFSTAEKVIEAKRKQMKKSF